MSSGCVVAIMKMTCAGRFFQGFQQRIEGGIGDLVGFIEDVDFVFIPGRAVAGALAQFSNFIDAAIGGGVNFDDVHGVAGANLRAGIAHSARLRRWTFRRSLGRAALQRHGKNAGNGRFADAAMSAENIAVRDPVLRQGIQAASASRGLVR